MEDDFVGKFYSQNCGDILQVLEKTFEKSSNGKYLYKVRFQKYIYETLAQKGHILSGNVNNPQIEVEEFLEKTHLQNCGDNLKVLRKSHYEELQKSWMFECEFLNYPCKILATKGNILRGKVNNPYIPVVCNKGFIGQGKFNSKEYKSIYSIWQNMLDRCYNFKAKNYHNYGSKGVIVCDEWFNFQLFANWYQSFKEQNYTNKDFNLNIDKDIIYNINKGEINIYSPKTCLLLPEELNCWLAGDSKDSGVFKQSNKYYSRYRRGQDLNIYIGTFDTFEEAKVAYAKEKYKYWKIEIDKYDFNKDLKELLLKYDFSWKWLI